jgi:hypothetical protein
LSGEVDVYRILGVPIFYKYRKGLNSVQLSEWEVYDKLDPIGTWREDFRFAKLTALIQNIVSSLYAQKGEIPKMISPSDEMPDWTGERKEELEQEQSVAQMKSILLGIAHNQNKKVERLNIKTPPPNKKKK